MRFVRYTSTFATGAAGFLSGFLYHDIAKNCQFLISAAAPVKLDIDGILTKDIDEYVNQYTPMMKFGFPSYDTIRLRDNFILSYDRRNRIPNWVMEHLTSNTLEKETCASRIKSKFFEDNTIHDYFRAALSDYRNSGYDRGHLAAAANHKHTQRSLDETFVLSNVAPQNRWFNRGIWHALEAHVRALVEQYGSVYVCSGPLYLPRHLSNFSLKEIHLEDEHEHKQLLHQQGRWKRRKGRKQYADQEGQKKYIIYEVIGENNVAVPTHFFKIVVCETEKSIYDMEAYIIPNEYVNPKTPLFEFMVPRDAIERAAGFLLFHQLPSSAFRCINGEETTDKSSMEL